MGKPPLSMRTVIARRLWLMHLPRVKGWDAAAWFRVLHRNAPYEHDILRACGSFEHETGAAVRWQECSKEGHPLSVYSTTEEVRELLAEHIDRLAKRFAANERERVEGMRRRLRRAA